MLDRSRFLARYGLAILRHSASNRLSISRKAGGSCVVLGNGPSLAQDLSTHYDAIASRPTVCVNSFARSEYYERLKPQYYVLADGAFFSASVRKLFDDIKAGRTDDYSPHTIAHFTHARDSVESTYENLVAKTQWPLTLFLPVQAWLDADLSWIARKNPNIRLVEYNMTPLPGGPQWVRHAIYRHGLAMPRVATVLVAAIFLMLQAGHKTVYVLGADHSWHENFIVGDDNVLRVRDPHFYDQGQAPTFPMVKDHITGESWTLREQWRSLAEAFDSHAALDAYARVLGARIYNAGSRSFLDTYERAPVGSKDSAPEDL